MLVAVVTLAVLVIVLGVAVVVLRRRLAAAAAAAAAAQAEVVRIEAESAVLRQELTDELASLRGQLDHEAEAAAQTEARLRDERDTARRNLDDERARLEEAEVARAQLDDELDELRQRHHDLELRREREALAADPSRAGVDLATLWELELARSERTWRHSVAPIPGGDSPFPDADDPLRLAIEVEAAALREEVGAPLEVHWDADVVKDPADALLVLRLAQELLARAARESRPAVLEVTGTDDVALLLTVGDGDDDRVIVTPPAVPDHLVSVTVDEGLRLVVHRS